MHWIGVLTVMALIGVIVVEYWHCTEMHALCARQETALREHMAQLAAQAQVMAQLEVDAHEATELRRQALQMKDHDYSWPWRRAGKPTQEGQDVRLTS